MAKLEVLFVLAAVLQFSSGKVCNMECQKHSNIIWNCKANSAKCQEYKHRGSINIIRLKFTIINAAINMGSFPRTTTVHVNFFNNEQIASVCNFFKNHINTLVVNGNHTCVSRKCPKYHSHSVLRLNLTR